MINEETIRKLLKLKRFGKTLRYNDRHRNTIRIDLKKEVETFSDKNDDLHQTHVC